MMRYSLQPRYWILVNGYEFLFFAKSMGKREGKNISEKLSGKYGQKITDHATDALKITSKRVIQKTTEATGDLIGNKIPDKITKISKTSQQNYSETVTNDNDKQIPEKDVHLQKEHRK